MKSINYQRKTRQLKFLSKQINRLSASENTISDEVQKMITRMKRLVHELKSVISHLQLKKILGPACLFLGLSFNNVASAQNYLAPVTNPFGLVSGNVVSSGSFADLDNDGDLDLLVGEYLGVMQYFRNTGSSTAPAFAAPVANPFGLTATYYIAFPAFADMDGDGDKDILVGEYKGALQYFQNTGTASAPAYAAVVTNPFGLTATTGYSMPAFADIDGDGDQDLFVGDAPGAIQYFQNTGTASVPAFAAAIQNPFGLTSQSSLATPNLTDLDGDGDKDLIAGDGNGNFNYFKNVGTASVPSFSAAVVNPFNLAQTINFSIPVFVDLDADGDKDLFVGEDVGVIKYFKNQIATDIKVGQTLSMGQFKLYPNPAQDFVQIAYEGLNDKGVKIEVMDVTGRVCITHYDMNEKISLVGLAEGMYSVKITQANGDFVIGKIQKQ